MKGIQTREIEIASIHDQERSWVECDLVQDIYVVNFSVSNINKYRYRALNIDQGVKLDRALGLSEIGPGKHRKTQIDGRGIQGVHSSIEVHPQIRIGIKRSGNLDESPRKVGIDPPISMLVSLG